ncbi:MAG: SDR family NAD(P)-dependent oxidoreductase [Pseudomonadota bacterium]
MKSLKGRIAIVTGASSGFGEAIAKLFAKEGANLAIGARRRDRVERLAKELEAEHGTKVFFSDLDVRDRASVNYFVGGTLKAFDKRIDILVNNAGLAAGRHPVAEALEADWVEMMETNFLGMFHMTQAVLPTMTSQKSGHIVNIGSIAGQLAYDGGAGYCGSKFAVTAFSRSLRLETIEAGIKVSLIEPGLAETEFSLVRFKGDEAAAKKVYEGMTPLTAEDVADAVLYVVTRPAHVVIEELLLTPQAQGGVHKVHRRSER